MVESEREEPEHFLLLLLSAQAFDSGQQIQRRVASIYAFAHEPQVVAPLRCFLPCLQMRVDIREDEVDASVYRLFANAVEAHELYIIAGALILTPLGIATKLEIDALFDGGSGPAGAGAEVNEGVGCQGGTEERAERGGKG